MLLRPRLGLATAVNAVFVVTTVASIVATPDFLSPTGVVMAAIICAALLAIFTLEVAGTERAERQHFASTVKLLDATAKIDLQAAGTRAILAAALPAELAGLTLSQQTAAVRHSAVATVGSSSSPLSRM